MPFLSQLSAFSVQLSPDEALDELRAAHPGVRARLVHERVQRLYGRPMAGGPTAAASAEAFLAAHAAVFGVSADELVPEGPFPDRAHAVPLMLDPRTGRHRFTSLHYRQARGGLEVFGARLTLLVREEPGHPLVLASADLRPLGGFQPPAGAAAPGEDWVLAGLGAGARVLDGPELVIWAGPPDGPATPPALAVACTVAEGPMVETLYVLERAGGAVLYRENRIVHDDVTGTVSGLATAELGADICGPEAPFALPYARVNAGETVTWTDGAGQFTLPHEGPGPALVQSRLWGLYFRVFNDAGVDALVQQVAVPPGPVDFVHNASNAFELERSQVNAYLHANAVRDYVLEICPAYPEIAGQSEFTVNVNLNDNCNAFYSSTQVTINFFTSGEGCPNTAFDTVVYHEFGHHLVNVGGSGQGAYGEGMSDTIAVLVTDQPVVGRGWRGDCELWLRRADNDCTYSPLACTTNCGDQIHACGRLISGCVWSLRNHLLEADPVAYRQILSALTLNSILLHTGSAIDPSITIDFLTLDDDNAELLDGTPHYPQIAAAFAEHGMDAPPLSLLQFELPEGLPELVGPAGGTAIGVEVSPLLAAPQPGTGRLHVRAAGAGGFVELPMVELEPNVYEAVVPGFDCGSVVELYFSALTTDGDEQLWPVTAPAEPFTVVAAAGVTVELFDDFETDGAWSVENDAGLTAGAWERGVPAGAGDRGDPTVDGDGSGACWLTGNAPGNSDVDGGVTSLISPPVEVGEGVVHVAYHRWYANAAGDNPFQDTLLVEVSGDGGDTWVELETVGPDGPEADGGWRMRRMVLDGLVEIAGGLRVAVRAGDEAPGSIVEAGLDGFTVSTYACSGCPGDATGDGTVDVGDLIAVILAWSTADPAADVDGSGLVDVEDLVVVVLAWGEC